MLLDKLNLLGSQIFQNIRLFIRKPKILVTPQNLMTVFLLLLLQESDGEKSDQDLVVDVANEVRKKNGRKNFKNLLTSVSFCSTKDVSSPHTNGDHQSLSNSGDIRENGSTNSDKVKVDRPPSRSGSSSSRSTPSLKSKDVSQFVSFDQRLFKLLTMFFSTFAFLPGKTANTGFETQIDNAKFEWWWWWFGGGKKWWWPIRWPTVSTVQFARCQRFGTPKSV